jgi:hypothetical protein
MTIKEVISTGKLKTYQHNRSFLEVYWHHPSLEVNQYYLFLFAGLNCSTPPWVTHSPLRRRFAAVGIIASFAASMTRRRRVFNPRRMLQSHLAGTDTTKPTAPIIGYFK